MPVLVRFCPPPDDEGPVTTNTTAVPNPVAVGSNVDLTANVDDTNTGGVEHRLSRVSLDGGACFMGMLASDCAFDEVAEDENGATVPTGNTEFQFKAGDLNFHSSSYEFLVITMGGTRAQYKGRGTINGGGDFRFMLFAGDGDPDTFRIRIWAEDETTGTESVVYDNGLDNGFGQPIIRGSIVIHTK